MLARGTGHLQDALAGESTADKVAMKDLVAATLFSGPAHSGMPMSASANNGESSSLTITKSCATA